MTRKMTIGAILMVEPKLKDIAREAAEAAKNNNPWICYGQAKARAYNLIGWGAEKDELRHSRAYEMYIFYLCRMMGI